MGCPPLGSTSDVVEASGTAKPGEVVPSGSAPVNRSALSRPVPARPWEQNYGSSIGGYGSTMNYNSGYGSGMYGSTYGGIGGTYGGGMYGSSMYNRGGLGGDVWRLWNVWGRYVQWRFGRSNWMGMGVHMVIKIQIIPMVVLLNNLQDSGFPFFEWYSCYRTFLLAAYCPLLGIMMQGVVTFFGRISFLVDQNTQAFHMFMTALLQLLERSGFLYGELARFVLRLLGIRTKPKKVNLAGHEQADGQRYIQGPDGQRYIEGPKAVQSGNWDSVWGNETVGGN